MSILDNLPENIRQQIEETQRDVEARKRQEPKPAEEALSIEEEVRKRFAFVDAIPDEPEEPPYVPTPEEIEEKLRRRTKKELLAGGYPPRHVDNLWVMEGPGLARARVLRPKAMDDSAIVLCGDRGPGKTQIATWLAAERIREDRRCGLFREIYDIVSDLKATWRPGSDQTEEAVMKRYCSTPFLVIDEYQQIGDSDWESRSIVKIINHRYTHRLPTVIIANLTESTVSSKIDASILSRIEETGGLVVCDWKSYRSR